jgi:hypothetical protein
MRTVHRMKLDDATVILRRGVELRFSPTETSIGHHMTVQHVTGHADDVVIMWSSGTPKVKRIVMHMNIATSSTPAIPAMTGTHFSLADLDEASERRFLAIYGMFPTETEIEEGQARAKYREQQENTSTNRFDYSMYVDDNH